MLDQLSALRTELLQKISPLLTGKELDYLKTTEIRLNPRLRTSLGRANWGKNIIELNSRVLVDHPEEIAPTFAHELAHIVAPLMYGRKGYNHDTGWRKVMELFGYEAERTHKLDLPHMRTKQKPVAFAVCGCEDRRHEIKARRLRKMIYGRTRYMCLRCKEHLSIVPRDACISG